MTRDGRSTKRRSAGVVVVRADGANWRCLLLRTYGYWDFPKGLVEPGETPLAAALREVAEETTLAGLVLRWDESFLETEPYSGGKVARYYIAESPAGEVSLPVSAALGRAEHHEFRWLPFPDAEALLVPRVRRIARWAAGVVGVQPSGRP